MNESSISVIVAKAIGTTGEYAQEGFRNFKAIKKRKSLKDQDGQMVYIICTKKVGLIKTEARKIEVFFKLQDWTDAHKLFMKFGALSRGANETIEELIKQKVI